ncbi:MAG TPA: hypothetical protein VNQ76_08545, partial [Planctomicrobium sp.]|nr:hypothetical protein [Planctomicrobium sp.]
GEESIESYMNRLLARTRQMRSGEEPSSPPAAPQRSETKPLASSYRSSSSSTLSEELIVETEEGENQEDVTSQVPARKARKLEACDKEALRADLNSFRELANYSTRTAVATCKVSRTSAIVRLMLWLSGLGWIVTGLLLASHFWLGDMFFLETLMVGGVTAMMTMLAGIRYWEVRHIAAVPAPQLDLSTNEKQTPSPKTESEEQGKGPLSFL